MKRCYDDDYKGCSQPKRPSRSACAGCNHKIGEDHGLRCDSGDHISCFKCITGRVEPKHVGEDFKAPQQIACLFRRGNYFCPESINLQEASSSLLTTCSQCSARNFNNFRLYVKCTTCHGEYCSLCDLGTHRSMSCRARAKVDWRSTRFAELISINCPAPGCPYIFNAHGRGNALQCNCGQQFSAVTGEAFADPQLYFCQISWGKPCMSDACHDRGHPLVRDSAREHQRNVHFRKVEALRQLEHEESNLDNLPLLILAARHEPESVLGEVAHHGGINLVKMIAKCFTHEAP